MGANGRPTECDGPSIPWRAIETAMETTDHGVYYTEWSWKHAVEIVEAFSAYAPIELVEAVAP